MKRFVLDSLIQLAKPIRIGIITGLASVMLGGCLSGGGSSSDDSTQTGTVSGRVYSGANGLANASVSVGSTATITDSAGNFTLTSVPVSERAVIRVTKSGYAETFKNAAVTENATTNVNIEPQAVGILSTGNSLSNAVSVSIPNSPASVSIPADGLLRADGSAATGTYSVALTAISPANSVGAMPGEYLAASGNSTTPIESWGALNTTLTDSTGAKLNLASGKTATIRIPVSTRNSTVPATIPLFYFNETTGLWVQDGAATLAGTAPNQYYQGTVTHFSVWNADQEIETVYLNGCVTDSDGTTRQANVQVTTDGITYSGASSARTDAQGNFRLAIKKGGVATVTALSGLRLSNTVSAGPYTADTTNSTCLKFSATSAASASIKLTWGENPRDVDSHLFTPNGSHVYYSNDGSLTSAPFASLDVDDTNSYGPEVVTLTKLMVGTYTYAVRNYSDTYSPGMTSSPVRVEFSRSGSVSSYVPGSGEGSSNDWWTAFKFSVSANCTITEIPVNSWSSTEPPNLGTGTPVYCTAP